MPVDAQELALSFEEQCEKLTTLNGMASTVLVESLVFLWHMLGTIVAREGVLLGRDGVL